MSTEADRTKPDDDEFPDPEIQHERFADRLREAGVSVQRFIDVHDGAKGSTDHTRHGPDAGSLKGNYGVYAGLGADTDVPEDPEEWRESDEENIVEGSGWIEPAHIEVLWLVDVDVDDYENDGDEPTAGLDSLPETFTIESPHTDDDDPGHRYYVVRGHVAAALEDATGTKNPSPGWGEVRVHNQYVVGPGSQISPGGCVHEWCDTCKGCDKGWCEACTKPDGGYYRIAEDREIAVLELDEFVEAILRDLDADADADTADADSPDAEADADPDEIPPYEPDPNAEPEDVLSQKSWIGTYLALGHEAAGLDDRSTSDWRICKDMIQAGIAKDDVRELLEDSKKTKAYHRQDGDYFENTWSNALDTEIKECREEGKPIPWADHDADGEDVNGDDALGWNDVMACFDSSQNGSTTQGYSVAARILDRDHSFVCIRQTEELYYFNPDVGHYVRKGRTFIEELLQQYIPGYTNSSRVRNIHENVRSKNYIDNTKFVPPEGKVNVQNGVLDLDTRELEPHSPDYFFTSCLSAKWDPDADAPRWVEFLTESLPETERRKVEEFIGYTLEMWHHKREKNLFIVGPRQSGKSTCLDTIQALHGTMPDVANLTPQQIADTQYDASALKEASLNCVNDINASKIEDTGTLKRTFSGERQKLERKFHDPQFAPLTAKHAFTANWLPRVVGQDESLFRRVLIVEFTNKIDDEDRDLDLKDDLQDELDGILKRAVEARDRLHEQGGFTNDRSDTDTRRKWDSWRDAHKRFLYTQFEITGDPDDEVGKDVYYRAYKERAGRLGYDLVAKQSVTKSLDWVPEIEVGDDAYRGIAWRDEDAAADADQSRDGSGSASGRQQGLMSSTDQPDGDSDTELTKDELTTRVQQWVDAFSTPAEGADRDDVLNHGEDLGFDRPRLDDVFETLKTNGRVYHTTGTRYRVA